MSVFAVIQTEVLGKANINLLSLNDSSGSAKLDPLVRVLQLQPWSSRSSTVCVFTGFLLLGPWSSVAPLSECGVRDTSDQSNAVLIPEAAI